MDTYKFLTNTKWWNEGLKGKHNPQLRKCNGNMEKYFQWFRGMILGVIINIVI